MKLILDSSVIAKLFLNEINSIEAMEMMTLAYLKNIKFVASKFLPFEVGNVFWKHLRKKDKDKSAVGSELIKRLFLLDIEYFSLDNDLACEVMKVALEHDITYYDAAHVALSKRNSAPLVTVDKELLRKFDLAINIKKALIRIGKIE
jgi:predicted nucleic acid-binding protein